MKAPYRILAIASHKAPSLGSPIPTLKEATAAMVWLHNHSHACDMVIIDAENTPVKARRNTGYRTAKTIKIEHESPYWQDVVDKALAAFTD